MWLAQRLLPARGLHQALSDKQKVFSSYEQQLGPAAGNRNFQALAFLAGNLVVDVSFLRDESLQQALRLLELAESLLRAVDGNGAPAIAAETAATLTAFQATIQKKIQMVETLASKMLKAHQAKDYAMLSDVTGALARDTLILAQISSAREGAATSESTGLTATSASEKAALLDNQVAQLHQLILDRNYLGVSDLARLVSQNCGVLADPSTGKAGQILQQAKQLQQALSGPESPAAAALSANLAKVSTIFNGPLMDKATQMEAQVAQLTAALKAMDHQKIFTMSITVSRSAAILLDSTIQKASLLAGFVPRIDSHVKAKDAPGALRALNSALS